MSDRKSDDEVMGHAALLLGHYLRILKEHGEMLAALKQFVAAAQARDGTFDGSLIDAYDAARAAIAKADVP